jgi:phosphoribosylglycinamide formyltransferase 1
MHKSRIFILASGNGSNAAVLMDYFRESDSIEIAVLGSNNKDALALSLAKEQGVPTEIFPNDAFIAGDEILNFCRQQHIDFIVLAGFLRKMPTQVIQHYANRIINIHPAILPHFGGKGMYGRFVHEAVIASGATFSGITVHLVNEEYDKGQYLAQLYTPLESGETPESLALKVQKLEHRYFPLVLEDYIHRIKV